MSQGSERRQAPRYARRMMLQTESDEGLVELESANIGPAGAYCVSPRSFPEMSRLEVTLLLPGNGAVGDGASDPTLRIQSVVVRSEPAGDSRYNIALFFTSLSDAERALLDRYLPTA